jgi:hypothetical protein
MNEAHLNFCADAIPVSLTPCFSGVLSEAKISQPLQRFPVRTKPLKRLICWAALGTPLKRGVNKKTAKNPPKNQLPRRVFLVFSLSLFTRSIAG